MLSATLEGINIFTPTLKIEKDTEDERKYDWFELIPQNGGQYYAERIKLKATAVYPKVRPGVSPAPIHNGNLTAHPLAGFKVKNYNETAILSEVQKALFLRIYDGLRGATKLPKKDIKFNNGIAKFHLDSVSYAKILHTKPMVSVHMIQDNDYKPAYELEDFDVEQWITISKVDVTGNGGWNNSDVPDWLEKKVWDIIKKGKASSGTIGLTFSYVNELGYTAIACGETNNSHQIRLNPTCKFTDYSPGQPPYSYRINAGNILKSTVYHEVRHTWQVKMAEIKEDLDSDWIPGHVNVNSVVLGIPFEDGQELTRGEQINDFIKDTVHIECIDEFGDPVFPLPPATCSNPYFYPTPRQGRSFSTHFLERDASRFACVFTPTHYCP